LSIRQSVRDRNRGGGPVAMLGNLYDRALDGRRAAELLRPGGHCVAEFDSVTSGVHTGWVRLESVRTIGPWFRWASVGIDCPAALAEEVGLVLSGIHPIGRRVVASLAVP
jgi:hypothetical protein